MFSLIRNKLLPFLIMALLATMTALLPEILGEQAKSWCEQFLGPRYPVILITFFLLLFIVAAYFKPEIAYGLFFKRAGERTKRYHIPASEDIRQILLKAKTDLGEAEPYRALNTLYGLKLQPLNVEISTLKARLASLQRVKIQGTESYDTESREWNKISRDILSLIVTLENELAESGTFYQAIRENLKTRYENRLKQKLSRRQPVNLRILPSNTGSSRQAAAAFVQYNEQEIPEKLSEYFDRSKGRLLLIGAPGAGKTTLLLQLVIELIEKESAHLPVILNLARWNKSFPTFEAWIQEILPSEMGLGISKKMAAEIVGQNRLILLLDGFDEVEEEHRGACLEAIGNYGVEAGRRFVISSRIDEYKKIKKSAPVHSQVEVGQLTSDQLEAQLQSVDIDKQPEARRLLVALKEDKLLREAAQVPFYFNILQLLFARGRHLHELGFTAMTLKERQNEIVEYFVNEEFRAIHGKDYISQKAKKYLTFFASRMSRENLVHFELTDLQYDWWEWTENEIVPGKLIEGWVRSMALTLSAGLIIGIYRFWAFTLLTELIVLRFFHGLIASVISYIILGIVMGLIFALKKGVSKGLIIGIILANTFGLYFNFIYRWHPVLSTSIFLLSGLLIGMVNGTIRLPSIFVKDNIRYSLKSMSHRFKIILRLSFFISFFLSVIAGIFVGLFKGIILGLFAGLSLGTIFLLSEAMSSKYYPPLIQINTPYQRFKSSTKALHFSILQHWHLLYLLSKRDLLPWKLVPFLNDMVERNILETDGASWRFRHRILQDYFAQQWVEQQNISTR